MADLSVERKLLLQNLRLRHFRLMLTLYETRSVVRTAELHHVSAAAISKTRAEIEALVGGPVFDHLHQRWEPTVIGAHMIAAARRITAELECLSSELVLLREGVHGSVTLGYRTNSMVSFIASTTSRFKAEFPDVNIRLIDGGLPELLNQMSKGEVDLIVSPMVEECRFLATSSVVLRNEEHVVIASRGHTLEGARSLSWDALVGHAWCMPPSGTRTRDHLEAALRGHALSFPSQLIESNSFLMTIALMQQMPLLSLVPVGIAWQLESEIATILPIAVEGVSDPVRLVWPEGLAMSPATRRFRDFILGEARDMPASRATRVGDSVTIKVADDEKRFRFIEPLVEE